MRNPTPKESDVLRCCAAGVTTSVGILLDKKRTADVKGPARHGLELHLDVLRCLLRRLHEEEEDPLRALTESNDQYIQRVTTQLGQKAAKQMEADVQNNIRAQQRCGRKRVSKLLDT
jgi:hypothetical protein